MPSISFCQINAVPDAKIRHPTTSGTHIFSSSSTGINRHQELLKINRSFHSLRTCRRLSISSLPQKISWRVHVSDSGYLQRRTILAQDSEMSKNVEILTSLLPSIVREESGAGDAPISSHTANDYAFCKEDELLDPSKLPVASLTSAFTSGAGKRLSCSVGSLGRIAPRVSRLGFLAGPLGILMAVAVAIAGFTSAFIAHIEHSKEVWSTADCQRCGGEGVETCDLCNGTGLINWEGKLYRTDPCPACLGKKSRKCLACNGASGVKASILQSKSPIIKKL